MAEQSTKLKRNLPLFLAAAGLILVVIGIISFFTSSDDLVKTTAKVVDVYNTTDREGYNVSDITVQYTVDGKDHTAVYSNQTYGKYKKGDDFTLYYKSGNPSLSTDHKSSKATGPVMLVLGVVMVGGTFALAIYSRKKQAAQKQ